MKYLIDRKFNSSAGIYVVKCITNNKVYVGQAIGFKRRHKEHKTLLKNNKHHNPGLQKAFNKYGIENFAFDMLEITQDKSSENLTILEQKHLDQYVANGKIDKKRCYNIRTSANSNIGFRHTLESKRKMSEAISKSVYQYDLDGNLIKFHKSIVVAAAETGANPTAISYCIHEKRLTANNFFWMLKPSENKVKQLIEFNKIKTKTHAESVICVDTIINEEKTFTSLKECANYLNCKPSQVSLAISKNIKFRQRYIIKKCLRPI